MPKFAVTQIQTRHVIYTIEAESEEQAIESLNNSFDAMNDFDGVVEWSGDAETIAEEIEE